MQAAISLAVLPVASIPVVPLAIWAVAVTARSDAEKNAARLLVRHLKAGLGCCVEEKLKAVVVCMVEIPESPGQG